MTRIYIDGGGIRAFWVGNGLNIVKILPVSFSIPAIHRSFCEYRIAQLTKQESAIKFLSYEQSKKVLARYWDRVSDPSELSSSSRFFAGGVGGITSQFAIYGLETLKTRIQSETGPSQVAKIMRVMWREGGIRTFYRGLTVSHTVVAMRAKDADRFSSVSLAFSLTLLSTWERMRRLNGHIASLRAKTSRRCLPPSLLELCREV